MRLPMNLSAEFAKNPKFQMIMNIKTECYQENTTHSTFEGNFNSALENATTCPRIFDGFLCWDETPASTVTRQPCPEYIVGFDPRRYAYKTCMETGSWVMNPETNKSWTNYTSCVDVDDLDFRVCVNNLFVSGYSISLVALLLSIVAFLYFRTLHCTRIRVHINLFVSFAINNILWIIWYRTVVVNVHVLQANDVWCQVLHVVTHYFMVASYFWMFCESLHMHIALVVVFVKDEVAMRWFYVIGWLVSLLINVIYAWVRYNTPGATERCWIEFDESFWIIIVPVTLSLAASFLFMINVIRVLMTKVRPGPAHYSMESAKKAARAAAILIPLFGLHFGLMPLRPAPDSIWEKPYQILCAVLTSFQGLCVSILFCFTNHEVMAAAKQFVSRFRRRQEEIQMTGCTGAESLVNTRDQVL